MRKYIATDGAEQQLGFFDTQLDASCAFAVAEDGVTRCLPAVGEKYAFDLFSDATCTTPIYLHTCASQPHKFVALVPGPSCTPGAYSAIYPVLRFYGGNMYEKVANTCTQFTTPMGQAYELGPKMAPGAFVSATETVE